MTSSAPSVLAHLHTNPLSVLHYFHTISPSVFLLLHTNLSSVILKTTLPDLVCRVVTPKSNIPLSPNLDPVFKIVCDNTSWTSNIRLSVEAV